MEKTADPDVVIEERRESYIRYRNTVDGRRWEVHGICDHRGDCLIGAVINDVEIKNHKHLDNLKQQLGKRRIDSELDVPVTPDFDTCCGGNIFRYVELD